jgi:hypothetical protein
MPDLLDSSPDPLSPEAIDRIISAGAALRAEKRAAKKLPAEPLYNRADFRLAEERAARRYSYAPQVPLRAGSTLSAKAKLALASAQTVSAPESAKNAIDRAAQAAEALALQHERQARALAPWARFLHTSRAWYYAPADAWGASPAVETRLDGSLALAALRAGA